MRRIICSYFYPKREKSRVLYLYNKLLKRRRRIFKIMSQKIRDKMKINRNKPDFNLFVVSSGVQILIKNLVINLKNL